MKQTVELDFSWVIPVFGYALLLLAGFGDIAKLPWKS